MSLLTPGQDHQNNTGKIGKDRIRYLVYTALDTDAIFLGRVLENAIPDAKLVEVLQKSTGGSFFMLDFPEQYEDKFELLISFSSSVKSYHLQRND